MLRGQADIHGAGHGCTDTHRGAIDRGDHRFLAIVDRQGDPPAGVAHAGGHLRVVEAGVHILHGRLQVFIEAEYVARRGQIHAGAEGPALSGDDNCAHLVVIAGAVEGVDQFIGHCHREGIELLRPVQREGEDVVGHFVAQGVVGHGGFSVW